MNDQRKSPLLWFHAALVGCGVVFCFGYALYDFIVRPEGGESPTLPLVFVAAGFILLVYLVRFVRTQLKH